MTNVLPVETQKMLWRMHRARFVLVLAYVLIVLALCTALALVPSYVALEMNTISEGSAEAATTAVEEIRIMTKSQEQLKVIAPVIAATSSPTIAIEHALAIRPKGVTIDRVRYVKAEFGQIMLSGKASREVLNQYRAILEADPMYRGVSVPVDALVGTQDGRFSVTIVGNF